MKRRDFIAAAAMAPTAAVAMPSLPEPEIERLRSAFKEVCDILSEAVPEGYSLDGFLYGTNLTGRNITAFANGDGPQVNFLDRPHKTEIKFV